MKNLKFQSVLVLGLILMSGVVHAQFNYEDALKKSIYFFDANRCGPDAGNDNVFSWRGACHVNDGDAIGRDLTGGFHDAGDHVKFGLPQAWSASTLGFALYEFKAAFDQSGSTTKLLSTLKYFTDYFLKSQINTGTFYYNVGDGNQDHGYWGSPEGQTGARKLIAADGSNTGADVCGQASAALALMYLNYKSVDQAYADRCLKAAKEIYDIGLNNLGRSDDGGGGSFYRSTSHFDDLIWGAIWLSIATNDQSYLAPVDGWFNVRNDTGDDPYTKRWAPAWDDATLYSMVKLYELTGEDKYREGVVNNLEWYRDDLQKTPSGLPWLSEWGVLRYASSEAGLGYLAAKFFDYAGYLEMGSFTMDYILGNNPRNSSYLTGVGNNPPVHPHHRGNEPSRGGPTNGIIGALVGGPGLGDDFVDDVNDFRKNEVAIDYNASYILGLAGRNYFSINQPPTPNQNPSVSLTAPSAGQTIEQGASITIAASASDSDGTIAKVVFLVDGASVGEDTTAPYSFSWTAGIAGNYSISARAVDNKNGSATSSTVSLSVTSGQQPPTTTNLALNKTATASSVENSGLSAANAVDGAGQSRWSSAFSDPQWLAVDLGKSYAVNRVIVKWEGAYGKAYQIQVSSNGTTWNDVISVPGNGGEDDIVFNDTQTRYIRMYGTERGTPYGYSIYEFEVYGKDGGVTPLPTVDGGVITGEPFSFTVGDGIADNVSGISLTGNVGETSRWIVTDDQRNILGLPAAPEAVDFDGAGAGTCFIYHLSYSGEITGLAKDANLSALSGNFDLSNRIDVIRTAVGVPQPTVDGGIISGGPFSFTVGDGIADNVSGISLTGNVGETSRWIVTDDQRNILGLPAAPEAVDFDGAGVGTCFIYHLSYSGEITGLAKDANLSALSGNFDLSNRIDVIRTAVVPGGGNDCKFGTPLASPLATLGNKSFKNVHILGSGGPNLSNVRDFTINWDLVNNGLYQFSMLTANGVPNWWNDLLPKVTQSFSTASPGVTITGSGFTNLDGGYYAAADGGNFVLVSKTGDFTIYFSNSAIPPNCGNSGAKQVDGNVQPIVFPNPMKDQLTLTNLKHIKRIVIVDLLGKEIYSEANTMESKVLSVANYKQGMYIISLIAKDGTMTRTAVVKN